MPELFGTRWESAVTLPDGTEGFKKVLRDLVKGYEFDVQGLYIRDGTIRPLPSESSLIGKVIEGSILEHLRRTLLTQPALDVVSAKSSRTYPDLTFRGSLLHPDVYAVDIKCARRKNAQRIESAIAIGTYDAEYFHYPNEKVANIEAPYSSYTAHLALIALYDYEHATARNVELLLAEKWRIATEKKASGTRSYVATSQLIDDLRHERGSFRSETDFNDFWLLQPVKASKVATWEKKRLNRSERTRLG